MMTENNNGIITATFEKDGVSVILRNINLSEIGKLEFKGGIFTADPVEIDSATIRVPHCVLDPVVVKPKLYIRETGNDFSLAEPYCINDTSCFNLVKITSGYYEYNVEHFTDYYISSSGGDYTTLKDCLDAINNTNGNSCVITETGYYAISGAYGYNITPYYYSGVIEAEANDITIDCNNSFLIGGGNGRGIFSYMYNNTAVQFCNIIHFDKGVYLGNVNSGLVNYSTSRDCAENVYYWFVTNNKILNSNFTNSNGSGIVIDGGGSENITFYNIISTDNTQFNLWIYPHTSGHNISNSVFLNSTTNSCVAIGDNSILSNNTIGNCLADNAAGFTMGSGNIIEKNRVSNDYVAAYGAGSSNNIIKDNLFNTTTGTDLLGTGLGFCLLFADLSDSNTIINNTFMNCTDVDIVLGQLIGEGGLLNNNITGNTFVNTTASTHNKHIYIMDNSVENTKVWLNNFYKYDVYDDGTSTSFCVEDEGNFYEESLTPAAGDCGPFNITVPNGDLHTDFINVTWTKQSSINPITYMLYYSNNFGDSWEYINDEPVSALNYTWNISSFFDSEGYYTGLGTGLYHIKIIPNDGLYDGTNINNTFFVLNELLGRPTNTSITINFINEANNISLCVEYGNESGNYANKTGIINATLDSLVEFNITGLSPDTVYYYRIIANDTNNPLLYAVSDERRFRTRRASFPFNFTVLSDAHISDSTSLESHERFRNILKNMTKNDNSDFALHLGDNIISNDNSSVKSEIIKYYRLFRNDVSPTSHPIPLFYVIGNHEGENGWLLPTVINDSRDVRKKYIPNPLNDTYSEGGSEHEDYYAFTWGDALFVVLNVMTYNPLAPEWYGNYDCGGYNWTLGAEQLEWLNNTLKAHNDSQDVDWKFIFAHHADGGNATNTTITYASPCTPHGEYGRGGGMAANVGEQAIVHDMMEKYDVQAFFYGHDHLFVNISVDGIQYICVGDPNPKGFDNAYNGYTVFKDSGRARVEVISNETAQVFFINQSEDVIFNLTLNSTI